MEGKGYISQTIKIEYDWKLPRCGTCMVVGYDDNQCPKRSSADVTKQNSKASDEFVTSSRKTFHGHHVGGTKFRPPKQVYRPIEKKDKASTSGT